MELGGSDAEIVRRFDHQRHPCIRRPLRGRFGPDEPGRRRNVLHHANVIKHRLRVRLPVDGVETHRVLTVRLDDERALQLARLARKGRQSHRRPRAEIEQTRPRRLIGHGRHRHTCALQGFHVAVGHAFTPRGLGIGGEVVVQRDALHQRHRHGFHFIRARAAVAAGHVIKHLARGFFDRHRPGVRERTTFGHRRLREALAAVATGEERHRVGLGAQRFHAEIHGQTGDDLGGVGVFAGADVGESRIRRPGDIGQKRPPGRVPDILRRDPRIQTQAHDDRRQCVTELRHR